ncbi:hypothetical protein DL96DRAFT_1743486 [Flagelloscypha sp. PMI_526]|nr:hypothetical protein DL96DRAFT_1743486 [Flagelloscypha sp. PMI_526]
MALNLLTMTQDFSGLSILLDNDFPARTTIGTEELSSTILFTPHSESVSTTVTGIDHSQESATSSHSQESVFANSGEQTASPTGSQVPVSSQVINTTHLTFTATSIAPGTVLVAPSPSETSTTSTILETNAQATSTSSVPGVNSPNLSHNNPAGRIAAIIVGVLSLFFVIGGTIFILRRRRRVRRTLLPRTLSTLEPQLHRLTSQLSRGNVPRITPYVPSPFPPPRQTAEVVEENKLLNDRVREIEASMQRIRRELMNVRSCSESIQHGTSAVRREEHPPEYHSDADSR